MHKLYKRLEDVFPEMVRFRRDLHMYPELSFQEVNTPKKISRFLKKLGLEVNTDVGGRGVVGILRGEKPGKTVALRADFDALPMQDEKDVEYRSRVDGVMHACGHDIHTATILGVAKVLSEVRSKIEGTIVFIHQFAEEVVPGGAKSMIEDGCLDGVDVIYGAHVVSNQPVGEIGILYGYGSSALDQFDIELSGNGGHGGLPHESQDSLVTGCQLVVNLQQIVSRKIDPFHPAVITVGKFQSGEAGNVIPNKVEIKGTIRTTHKEDRDLIKSELKKLTKSTCEAAGINGKCNYTRGYPAVNNDIKETNRLENVAKDTVGEKHVVQIPPITASEDFARYLERVPGVFFTFGGDNPKLNTTYPNHHPRFDVDEASMLVAGKVFISTVFDFLKNENEFL